MPRRLSILLACLALVGTLGCGQTQDEPRFDTRMLLVRSYGQLGRGEELRTLAAQLARERRLRYREIDAIAEAAIAAEDWQLALEQSQASLAFASPAHYKEDTPEASDEIAQTYGTRRVAYSLANKGWAQLNLGQVEAAFESFARAKESTTFNFLGVDDTQLHRYWGQALLRNGEPEKAMEMLATEALFGVDPTAREAYRQAYVASHGDGENGFEEHLWNLRRQNATPAPDFALPNYDGETVRLSQFRGDVVLLAFWFPT